MSSRINYKIKLVKYLKKIDRKKLKTEIINSVKRNKQAWAIALSFIVYFVLVAIVAGSNKNIIKMEDKIMFDGKTFITDTCPVFKDVVIVGDSYSHHIAEELGYDTTIYSSPGLTVKELNYCFESAKKNQKKYVVIFIGPNDFRFSVAPEIFYDELKKNVEQFNKKSQVILCGYLPSMYTEELEEMKKVKYKVVDYDAKIKKIAAELKRVYYFDLSELSNKPEYYKYNTDKMDKIHFNHNFYIDFINKLNDFILSIR